ncbi:MULTISPECIES: vanadium-dependent haloperoxidase [Streptomyces]|uniref:vanadium-dependent haloperoxidase n=1 Tax=Streptomyces TaxID=1883 RepID=UPI001D13EAB8|nr:MULTISPECIES: vanadium-dependent haloperoxidase [Streptomyces]MCC3653755.1 vanadium-dependent haloperoxidase [Streptomyces sp. S07_1.15]WSQ71718.1 vanadium-dependent haloperoxidase [Streptomyces xinghaiensis]
MTHPHRPVRGRSPRTLVLACVTALAVATTGFAVAETRDGERAAAADGRQAFDFAEGNSALEVIYPRVGPAVRKHINQVAMDGTLVLRISALMESSWFDATAPYHPTAVGIHSDLGRRPASEATQKNLNTAMLYSTYRVMQSLMPTYDAQWREMLTSVGLDPDDDSTDRTTPVGLGNAAGNAVVEKRENDGMNQLGNEGGQKYHQRPYSDYTGYKPVNTPYKIRNPSRWQPAIVSTGNGIFFAQSFVTAQLGRAEPYSFADPKDLLVPKPRSSNHRNRAAYKRQADEVLRASANLTDEQKLKAEFFNDKLIFASGFMGEVSDDLMEFIHSATASHIAGFDVMLASWYNKRKYDAPRPFTAIRYLYAGEKLRAWGGPGKGTVDDMPAEDWQSYLQVSDHPEYPSGSTAFCAAQAEVGKLVGGGDKTDIRYDVEKGGSYIEPGVTPAKDTSIRWTDWNEMVDDCAKSRVWGGVHFRAATEASKGLGAKVGESSYRYVQSHIEGKQVGSMR